MTRGSDRNSGAALSADETAPTQAVRLAGTGRTVEAWLGNPPTGTYEYRLAVLVDGTPCPICGSSPVFRHRMLDRYRTDAAGR